MFEDTQIAITMDGKADEIINKREIYNTIEVRTQDSV